MSKTNLFGSEDRRTPRLMKWAMLEVGHWVVATEKSPKLVAEGAATGHVGFVALVGFRGVAIVAIAVIAAFAAWAQRNPWRHRTRQTNRPT